MIHEFATKEQELENSQDYGYEFLLSCFSLLSVIDPMLGFTASDAVEWSTTGMFDTVMLLLSGLEESIMWPAGTKAKLG